MRAAANSNRECTSAGEITPADAKRQPEPSREFFERQAFEAFRAFVAAFQRLMASPLPAPESPEPQALALPESAASRVASGMDASVGEVMTADEVAAFLGVDRNTVYDYAGRGVIPHQRVGKRLLFRRGGVVAWLDASLCAATASRKR